MKNLSIAEVEAVSGAISNVNACVVGTSIAGAVIGGTLGAYATLGFGAGAGAGWGATAGGWVGSLACDSFFTD